MIDTSLPTFWFYLQSGISSASVVLLGSAFVGMRLRKKYERDAREVASWRELSNSTASLHH